MKTAYKNSLYINAYGDKHLCYKLQIQYLSKHGLLLKFLLNWTIRVLTCDQSNYQNVKII